MEKIHSSWIALKPNEDEKHADYGFEEYYKRILKDERFKHIPKEVFSQGIYELHQDEYTIKNYAWIDYENIAFELCIWSYHELRKVYIIEDFRGCIADENELTDFSEFSCNLADLEYWVKYGTWRVPPIIIAWNTINSEIPVWCERQPPHQLVEGHSRFRYLFAAQRISELKKGKVASLHKIYMMKEKAVKF